jgi:hypothetical protein
VSIWKPPACCGAAAGAGWLGSATAGCPAGSGRRPSTWTATSKTLPMAALASTGSGWPWTGGGTVTLLRALLPDWTLGGRPTSLLTACR